MDKQRRIVSDTGPLISLEKLADGYQFIRVLYDRILVPPAVIEELVQGQFSSIKVYITHYEIDDLIEVFEVEKNSLPIKVEVLDPGEQEAIRLALLHNLPLLIEEEAGRKIARQLGVKISGIAGQILQAFRSDLIDVNEAEQKLEVLHHSGRINRKIYQGLLEAIRQRT